MDMEKLCPTAPDFREGFTCLWYNYFMTYRAIVCSLKSSFFASMIRGRLPKECTRVCVFVFAHATHIRRKTSLKKECSSHLSSKLSSSSSSVLIIIIIITTLPNSGPVLNLHRSELFRQSDPVFPLSGSITAVSLSSSGISLSLHHPLPVTSIFSSVTCSRRQFQRTMWPSQLVFLFFIVCRKILSSLIPFNISSFFTRSSQMIFSNSLQHHISKFSKYFWSTFWNVQFSEPY